MNLSKMLRSCCRRKILKALSEKKEITIMKLVRTVNSTYNEVDRNLRILEREGILAQRYVGRRRVVCLNFKSEKTLVLIEVLKIRENSVDLKHLRRNLKRLLENSKENDNWVKH